MERHWFVEQFQLPIHSLLLKVAMPTCSPSLLTFAVVSVNAVLDVNVMLDTFTVLSVPCCPAG